MEEKTENQAAESTGDDPQEATYKGDSVAFGIRPDAIAQLCHVDVVTARRWKSGESRIPYAAEVLLSGDLGAFSKRWNGWKIRGDAIITPDGTVIKEGDVRAFPFIHGQMQALRVELAAVKECAAMQEQPILQVLPAAFQALPPPLLAADTDPEASSTALPVETTAPQQQGCKALVVSDQELQLILSALDELPGKISRRLHSKLSEQAATTRQF